MSLYRCKICNWVGALPEDARELSHGLYRFNDVGIHSLASDSQHQKKHVGPNGRRKVDCRFCWFEDQKLALERLKKSEQAIPPLVQGETDDTSPKESQQLPQTEATLATDDSESNHHSPRGRHHPRRVRSEPEAEDPGGTMRAAFARFKNQQEEPWDEDSQENF